MWRNFSNIYQRLNNLTKEADDFKTVTRFVELELWLSYLYLILYRVLFTITM